MINKFHILYTVLLFTVISQACEIPVFRYALERWQADSYRLNIYVPKGRAVSPSIQKVIDLLKRNTLMSGGDANFLIEITDRDQEASTFELLYPIKSGIKRPVKEGRLEDLSADLLSSPSREKLGKQILSGKSIVWLIIPGQDSSETEKFKASLKKRVSKVLSSVKLSDGIIKKENSKNKNLSEEELENILHSQIPLNLSFEVIEVKSDDPEESIFINMLLRQSPAQLDYKGPIAYPVFGRGRVLEGVSDLESNNIEELTTYLSSHCSCTVKEENPGIDLLMNVPWADHVAESQIQFRDVLPPLEGFVTDPDSKAKVEIEEVEEGISIASYVLTISGVMALCLLFLFAFNRTKSH